MTSSSDPRPLLIQVVPRLTPGRCGVSDQAVLLAHELQARCAIESAFVILNSDEQSATPYAAVHCPPGRLLQNCRKLSDGRTAALLLHISGYGYSRDGAPTLLADALPEITRTGKFRTAAYFHENFASGPPWKSAFWYKRRQQEALRRIVAQCGLIVTNIRRHAAWLEHQSRSLGVPVEQLPVFSPAGETDAPAPIAQRDPAMIVFGLRATREKAYRLLAEAGNLLTALGVQQLLDVGPERVSPAAVNGIPVEAYGKVPAEQLPALFSKARFGFVTHEWSCLGKSSVFAGYCAQGTIPVLAETFPEEADGIEDGIHVLSPRTAPAVPPSGWEACSRAAWNWYMGHSVSVHAKRYARWMGELS